MKTLNEYITEGKWDKYRSNKYNDIIKSAVYDYVSGLTTGINNELRSGKKSSKTVIKELDLAFTSNYACKMKLNVFRVVDWDYLNNIYNITKYNIDDNLNKVFINKAYISTTKIKGSVWGSFTKDEVLINIISDNTINAIDVNYVIPAEDIDCEEQQEVLLPRNMKFKILSYTIDNDGIYNFLIKIL